MLLSLLYADKTERVVRIASLTGMGRPKPTLPIPERCMLIIPKVCAHYYKGCNDLSSGINSGAPPTKKKKKIKKKHLLEIKMTGKCLKCLSSTVKVLN